MSAEIILAGGLVASSIAKEVIVATTTSVYSLIVNIVSYEYKDLTKTLEDMDIDSQIKVIDAFVSDINNEKIKSSKALQLIVNDVYNCVLNIHSELQIITEKCESHRKSWFYYVYKLDCSKELGKLEHQYKILGKRFEMLIKIMSML